MWDLTDVTQRFESIMVTMDSGTERDVALSELVTEIERNYRVPLIYEEVGAFPNKAITSLHQMISDCRGLE